MSADLLALARVGQNKGTGATDALFLDLGADELLTAYDKKKIFSGTVKEKTIKGGRSLRFILTGRRKASYHNPGAIIDGTNNSPSDNTSRVIYLDGLLHAAETIYDLDPLREDPSTRAEFMHQLGEALADEREARVARVLFAAGNTSTEPLALSINTGRTGDKITLSAGYSTANNESKGDELAAAIKAMVILKQKKHVPMSNFVCVMTPEAAGFCSDSKKIINADWNGASGANGTVAEQWAGKIYGVPCYWSNFVNQPAYSLVTGDNANSAYAQDLSKCVAILYHRDAIGVLNLRKPMMQFLGEGSSFQVMYQSNLFVASMAMGMGVLAPECAGIIVTP